MFRISLFVIACILLASPAEARHRHHHRHHYVQHHHYARHHHRHFAARHYSRSHWVSVQLAKPWQEISYGLSPAFEQAIGRPMRYISGRLVCAVNVNAALAERGIKGTGSALAMSFRNWGRSAGGPVPGAVIVSSRRGGGHVAIVSRVRNGVVYAWNATGGVHGWREIPYRHSVIDYRVPG